MTTKNQLDETVFDRDLQKHLLDKHVTTEHTLLNQAKTLLNVAETATTDSHKLHEKISRKQLVFVDKFYFSLIITYKDIIKFYIIYFLGKLKKRTKI